MTLKTQKVFSKTPEKQLMASISASIKAYEEEYRRRDPNGWEKQKNLTEAESLSLLLSALRNVFNGRREEQIFAN